MAGETFAYFLTQDPNTAPLPLPVGSDDRVAVVRGAYAYWALANDIGGGGGGGGSWTIVNETTALPEAFEGRVGVDNVTSASMTVTLPLNPTNGQDVLVKDITGNAGSYTITVIGDGALIEGQASMDISTSAVAKSVLGLSLTAGKWECWGASRTIPAATTTQSTNATSISAVLDTILSAEDGGEPQQYSAAVPANSTIQQAVGMTRVTVPPASPVTNSCLLVSGTTTNCLLISGTTIASLLAGTSGGGGTQTMYLVNNTTFATDILSVAGRLNCRRWG
jgi:hypothetical protein